jgi:hypothetical protein
MSKHPISLKIINDNVSSLLLRVHHAENTKQKINIQIKTL